MTQKLISALLETRKAIKNPPLDSVNPHFRSKFASLKAVVEHTVEVAAQHGICVIGDPQKAESGIDMYTVLAHESGEEMRLGPMFFPCAKRDAQGYASALTYSRRYHLMSIFNVVGDVDDDGNEASKKWEMPEKMARDFATLLDDAVVIRDQNGKLESFEGVDEFATAWMALDQEKQKAFGPWISTIWPGEVSKIKAHMRDVMQAWRANQQEAA